MKKTALLLLLACGCNSAPKKPLYERLGGSHAIAAVADDFINRLFQDETLLANPATIEAAGRITVPGIKFQLTAQLIEATGGPDKYHGRDMKSSHAHLNIPQKEWDAAVADLLATLEKFRVPRREKDEIIKIVAGTKKDIVVDKPTGAKADPRGHLPPASDTSLYGRLGGAYNIAAVVDDLIERLLVNDTLNANPRIAEARDRMPKAALKYMVTLMLCEAAGGPHKYTGRSMKESHAHMKITEKEWEAMVADFKATLDKFKVPPDMQKELYDIAMRVHDDIVTGP